jgi:hypothetical protein
MMTITFELNLLSTYIVISVSACLAIIQTIYYIKKNVYNFSINSSFYYWFSWFMIYLIILGLFFI